MVRFDRVMVVKLTKNMEIEIVRDRITELLEFSISFSSLSCIMLVYVSAKNTAASSGTGRREVSVRIFGKGESLPM